MQTLAKELVAMQPEVIFAMSRPATAALQKETGTIPIVFTYVIDPIGAGFIASLARPGGNLTGIMAYDPSVVGKWLGMLKEIAPGVTRAAVLRDSALPAGIGQFAVIQSVATSIGVSVSAINVRDAGEIERAVIAFARTSNGGLILTASALAVVHRDLIITLAARHKLPAVYVERFYVKSGGPDLVWAAFRRQGSAHSRLRRSHSQGREAGGSAGASPDKIRAGDQSQDCEGARPHRAALAANPRR